MPKYDLDRLGWEEFENLVQALLKRIIGSGTRVFLFSSPSGQEFIDPEKLDRLAERRQAVVATLVTEEPRHVWTVASTPLEGGLLLQAGRISTPAFEAASTSSSCAGPSKMT